MFDYISGTLIEKTENYAVVDAGGIGYRIFSTQTSLDDIGEAGRNVKLYIFMNIKNASDMVSLYGFSTKEERNTFEMILGVSGVGAKTAAALLSNISASKFALCVVTGDSKYLSANTPGLGPKGAQRIILELKDKFKHIEVEDLNTREIFTEPVQANDEAVSALVVLGYSRTEAEKALIGATGTTEEKIKYALKRLM